MPRSPQWMDFYQIWFRVSSRGRNQLCGILLQSAHGFRFCEGLKFAISHWLGTRTAEIGEMGKFTLFLLLTCDKIGSVAYVELIFTDFSYVGYTCNHKKRWYYPPAHRLNVNVMLSNITFFVIFAFFTFIFAFLLHFWVITAKLPNFFDWFRVLIF